MNMMRCRCSESGWGLLPWPLFCILAIVESACRGGTQTVLPVAPGALPEIHHCILPPPDHQSERHNAVWPHFGHR